MGASYVTRGILIGASLGVFAALTGISSSMFISVGFGMFAGFFAGLTKIFMVKKQQTREKAATSHS